MIKPILIGCLLFALSASVLADNLVKDKNGCQMSLDFAPKSDASYLWQGQCEAGYATGQGTLLSYEKEQLKAKQPRCL